MVRKNGKGVIMEIRPAKLEDVPALVDLWIEFMDFHSALDPDYVRSPDAVKNWTTYVTEKIADEKFHIMVAVDQGRLIGHLVATIKDYPPVFTLKSYGFIQEIAVNEIYRREGVGRRLYDEAEEWLLSKGVNRIQIRVDSDNEISRSFWQAVGFAPHTETLLKKF
jgi:ribosomal protein S18 acetylase RimI-like enzyme